ncbi:MAG: MBL fold metallo-hydrolase [Chloroflexota bacterium]
MKIYTLDLNYQKRSTISAAYLVVGSGRPVLVETGPGSTLATLQAKIAQHGYEPNDIKHVLVTHSP